MKPSSWEISNTRSGIYCLSGQNHKCVRVCAPRKKHHNKSKCRSLSSRRMPSTSKCALSTTLLSLSTSDRSSPIPLPSLMRGWLQAMPASSCDIFNFSCGERVLFDTNLASHMHVGSNFHGPFSNAVFISALYGHLQSRGTTQNALCVCKYLDAKSGLVTYNLGINFSHRRSFHARQCKIR